MGASLTRLKSFDSVLPADAALFHTAPRRTWVITVMGVDPNQSSLNLGSETMGFADVLRPQACTEAILARVGQKQAFSFLLSLPFSISRVLRKKGVMAN